MAKCKKCSMMLPEIELVRGEQLCLILNAQRLASKGGQHVYQSRHLLTPFLSTMLAWILSAPKDCAVRKGVKPESFEEMREAVRSFI